MAPDAPLILDRHERDQDPLGPGAPRRHRRARLHLGSTEWTEIDQWKTTIGWGLPEKDTIPARLTGIIEAIEQTCRPVIQQIGQ